MISLFSHFSFGSMCVSVRILPLQGEQTVMGSVFVFQTWMPKESFSRHLKCSAWSPALTSSHTKEKEPTFSLANKMGKGSINFCLVLARRISWEFIPLDFSSLKVCCQQRKRGHQENNSSYILRQRACKQPPPSAHLFRGWALKVNPSNSGFSSTASTLPSSIVFHFSEDLHVHPFNLPRMWMWIARI